MTLCDFLFYFILCDLVVPQDSVQRTCAMSTESSSVSLFFISLARYKVFFSQLRCRTRISDVNDNVWISILSDPRNSMEYKKRLLLLKL